MNCINFICNKQHKFRKNIVYIIENAELDDYKKAILVRRFVKQVVYYERKCDKFRYYYNLFRTSVTIGSILLPALLSIQNITLTSDGNDDKYFQRIVYWLTWGISLGVTVCNGIIQLYSLDKLYYSSSMLTEKLKSEGWKFFQLSGKYQFFSSHDEAFIPFCDEIEKLKMEQVIHEYSELPQDKNKDNETITSKPITKDKHDNKIIKVLSAEEIQKNNIEINNELIYGKKETNTVVEDERLSKDSFKDLPPNNNLIQEI